MDTPTIIVIALLLAIGGIGSWLMWYDNQIRFYGKRLRNFYEYSRSPKDKEVIQRANIIRRWLDRAKNESGVQVVVILYRDKMNPLETWEEYEARKHETIKTDMIQRDTKIEKEEGRQFYLEEIHGQYGDAPTDGVEIIENVINWFHDPRIPTK